MGITDLSLPSSAKNLSDKKWSQIPKMIMISSVRAVHFTVRLVCCNFSHVLTNSCMFCASCEIIVRRHLLGHTEGRHIAIDWYSDINPAKSHKVSKKFTLRSTL